MIDGNHFSPCLQQQEKTELEVYRKEEKKKIRLHFGTYRLLEQDKKNVKES